MNSKDLMKGDKVLLKNGWYAVLLGKVKGNIVLAEVDGYFKECGSIYVKDIAGKVIADDGSFAFLEPLDLSPKEEKFAKQLAAMGF